MLLLMLPAPYTIQRKKIVLEELIMPEELQISFGRHHKVCGLYEAALLYGSVFPCGVVRSRLIHSLDPSDFHVGISSEMGGFFFPSRNISCGHDNTYDI